jgi:hypothetical protein
MIKATEPGDVAERRLPLIKLHPYGLGLSKASGIRAMPALKQA